MFCSNCGKEALAGDKFCRNCGVLLEGKRVVVEGSGGLDVLVPPNAPALWAYYLGIGSLACFLTSIPAVVMGILGIRHANRHPEARGKIHAWAGILLGLFGLCLWAAMIAVFVAAVGPLRK
ncbi:MAG: DUF4190 domain-containing protein [Lentisphaeria bacterium]|nr:DUF4190 domain-containing protein [Lentisphaeria bacterium]